MPPIATADADIRHDGDVATPTSPMTLSPPADAAYAAVICFEECARDERYAAPEERAQRYDDSARRAQRCADAQKAIYAARGECARHVDVQKTRERSRAAQRRKSERALRRYARCRDVDVAVIANQMRIVKSDVRGMLRISCAMLRKMMLRVAMALCRDG